MKFLRLLILALTAGIVFTSCQKELSAETGSAIGTLAKDAAGDCSPIGVSGAYKKDTALNATNFVDVQLDVTNVGIYIVSTDTVNGYYFRATGVTPLPGANSIRLVGFGIPIAVGTDNFTVKFGGTTCEFNVNVTLGTGGGGGTTAVFTFPNGAACTGASQTPNFFVGVPTNAAINTMTIPVIVTQAGTYSLSTTSAGGLIFSGAGTLAMGNQQIVLGASGTPASPAGTINYTFSTTTPVASSCGFGLTVLAAPTPATFTFNCGSPIFTGTYQQGVNTIGGTLKIQVTSIAGGLCTISSNGQNGVTFSTTTVLAASPTPQDVILFASGIAAGAGPFIYTITGVGGTGICSVTQIYSGLPTASNDSIVGDFDGVRKTFNIKDTANLDNTSVPGFAGIAIFGNSDIAGTDTVGIAIAKLGTSLTTGTYTVNQLPNAFIGFSYITPIDNYTANSDFLNPTVVQTPGFTITILTLTSTKVTGTFSGRLYDNDGTGPGFKTVANGIFSVTIY
jgi:hypothetical protein